MARVGAVVLQPIDGDAVDADGGGGGREGGVHLVEGDRVDLPTMRVQAVGASFTRVESAVDCFAYLLDARPLEPQAPDARHAVAP